MNDSTEENLSSNYFDLLGLPHLIALGLTALIILFLIFYRNNFTSQMRLLVRYGLITLFVVNEVLSLYSYWASGFWTIKHLLPLHLCSLLTYLCILLLLTKKFYLYEWVYFLGLAGTTQALLTPDLGPLGFPHPRFFWFFIMHSSIVITAAYMTAVEQYRPTWASLKRVVISANLYLGFVYLVNQALDTNYMYLAHKPVGASLLDYLGPWPWYILSGEILGLGVLFLLYLPWHIFDLKQKQGP